MTEQDFHHRVLPSTPSSSEEERDDRIRDRGRIVVMKTPHNHGPTKKFGSGSTSTPLTVTQMTPSPIRTPFIDRVSPHPGAAPTRAPVPLNSFLDVQQGFLDTKFQKALFRDITPTRSRRKSRSRRSRLSQSLLLEDYDSPPFAPRGLMGRRRSSLFRDGMPPKIPLNRSSPEVSSESSPETSPSRHSRSPSTSGVDSVGTFKRGRTMLLAWAFLLLVCLSAFGMLLLTPTTEEQMVYEPTRPELQSSGAGLRGKMVQGHWEDTHPLIQTKKEKAGKDVNKKRKESTSHSQISKTPKKKDKAATIATKKVSTTKSSSSTATTTTTTKTFVPEFQMPPSISKPKQTFKSVDQSLYTARKSTHRRVVALDPSIASDIPPHRKIQAYPADFTDNTQLYPILDSEDERLNRMEIREPYSDDQCVPMQDWQTTFHPLCNSIHELSIESLGEDNGDDVDLFGTKGYWRNAWKVDVHNDHSRDTIVMKTLKYQHNFEDAHFEHDRIDAVAMERLTSSPHVINAFGFCGHSVLTEFADGSRVGELADKSKKKPLARLKIASDIAHGLADVHGIDGNEDGNNATFVHLDVNPANVVSIGGTLKLNDFNIGIIRRWNVTSNKPCGFPAQYPNPQWRSPEEARNEQDLTEKVDVFSMGHIFFRLICGHEPWNKLEPNGRPSKEEVNRRVQRGDLPYIPTEVLESTNPEVIAIRNAMLSCYTYDPTQRPSAKEIAKSLDDALEVLLDNTSYDGSGIGIGPSSTK